MTNEIDPSDINADAPTTNDTSNDGTADDQPGEDTTESFSPTRRGFGGLMLAGTAGLLGLSQPGSAGGNHSDGWRREYRRYAKKYIPEFYKSVPKKKNLYRCVRYTAKYTDLWKTLDEKMNLHDTVVTSAYAYPKPNYKKVDKRARDGILSPMLAGMSKKYRKKRKYPVFVPVFVVYLYDGYYNAVVYLNPYGKSFTSYGYVTKTKYRKGKGYNSKSDYDLKTWWFTEEGWGDASDTPGAILDGTPTGLID